MVKIPHNVICLYCGKKFDRDKIPVVQIGRRYAHQSCADNEEDNEIKQTKDRLALLDYTRQLLNLPYADAKIKKQIETYVNEYNFTYSGMLKALKYFYEIKGNDIKSARGGIGIIPYIYQESYDYYYNIWKAQVLNQNKKIEDFIPAVIEINIPAPQRKNKKRKIFSFLDEEEIENGEE